jgi:REP element-mobilizing transposase RayT
MPEGIYYFLHEYINRGQVKDFWSGGYFVNTVSKFDNKQSISKYVRSQGVV